MTTLKKQGVTITFGLILASALSSLTLPTFAKEVVAYTNAKLLDPSLEMPISDSTILVSQGKILKIQPDTAPLAADVKTVDLQGKWVIPGLIDSHVHLAQSGGPFARPDIVNATKIRQYQDEQEQLLNNHPHFVNKYLRLGITSIYDLGGPTEYLTKYSQLSDESYSPEIYFAGALLSPRKIPALHAHGSTYALASTSKEAIQLVEQQIEQGSHIVKVLWDTQEGQDSKQLFQLFQPAIAFAKNNNRVVAIHVEDLNSAKWAVKAGADIIVHGVMREPIDDELIAMMLAKGVTYSPTLTAFEHYFEFFKGQLSFNQFQLKHALNHTLESFSQLEREAAKADQMYHLLNKYLPMVDASKAELSALSEQEQGLVQQLKNTFSENFLTLQKANLRQVIDAGVNVTVGSDAGNIGTLHGTSLLGEMYAWQSAGIANKDIIKAATLASAMSLKLEHSIGSLSSGKTANFVVLNNNPYLDLSTLQTPAQVYKQGIPVFNSN